MYDSPPFFSPRLGDHPALECGASPWGHFFGGESGAGRLPSSSLTPAGLLVPTRWAGVCVYVWQFDTQLSSHRHSYHESGPWHCRTCEGPGAGREGNSMLAGEGQARRWLPVAGRAAHVNLLAVTSSGVPCEVRWKAAARDLAL